ENSVSFEIRLPARWIPTHRVRAAARLCTSQTCILFGSRRARSCAEKGALGSRRSIEIIAPDIDVEIFGPIVLNPLVNYRAARDEFLDAIGAGRAALPIPSGVCNVSPNLCNSLPCVQVRCSQQVRNADRLRRSLADRRSAAR